MNQGDTVKVGTDFIKATFIAQAKYLPKKFYALKCAGKAIKHRQITLESSYGCWAKEEIVRRQDDMLA